MKGFVIRPALATDYGPNSSWFNNLADFHCGAGPDVSLPLIQANFNAWLDEADNTNPRSCFTIIDVREKVCGYIQLFRKSIDCIMRIARFAISSEIKGKGA
ncbi:MAG: hypothetical protein AAF217_14190 [Pseudomonadota bacterium]